MVAAISGVVTTAASTFSYGDNVRHFTMTLMVPQPLHLPLVYEDWLPVVGQHGRGQVLLPYEDYHTGGMYHLPDSPSGDIVRSIIGPAMVTSPTMLHHRSYNNLRLIISHGALW